MTDRRQPFDWWGGFLQRLRAQDVRAEEAEPVPPARVVQVYPRDWAELMRLAREWGMRWCAKWADPMDDGFQVAACLEHGGDYMLIRALVPLDEPILPSDAGIYPAADRMERHIRDLTGVGFAAQPDARRWTRHQAWPPDRFPLRRDYPKAGDSTDPTPPDADYPFLRAQGSGVCEIPVGPIHAGIIEPGHFRFQAVGETVLNLEERLGYTHKGTEKVAEGRDAAGLARLAGRVSGDTTVAHTWAACMAMERAAGIDVPTRALWLRALMAERERVANHLGDIGAICNDVGFAFAQYQFTRLREQWQRVSAAGFGHRLMMDRIVPGGVATDLAAEECERQAAQVREICTEVEYLMTVLRDQESLQDRLVTTGILPADIARSLGCLGYVGRASGHAFDLRKHAPYPPYDGLEVAVPVYTEGDVATRLQVRADELLASLGLIERMLLGLPAGDIAAVWTAPSAGASGIGLVEGWRGEILAFVRFDTDGTIARYFPRDPSWMNWPALEHLLRGNIVPDFPVCNKSVNGSYSGVDL